MNRAARSTTRAPLSQRNVNIENQTHGSLGASSSKSSAILLPSKKDVAPISSSLTSTTTRSNSLLQRQQSAATATSTGTTSITGSETMSSIGGGGSGGGEANRAFTSLSSETLRHAINSASSVEPGGPTTTKLKKKPLVTSSIYQPNIIRSSDAPLQKKSSCTGTTTVVSKSPSSSEQVTIVEHRKRPCGDGFTVHTYLRGKLLGKGGFAKVYKVTSLDTNKEYAVKIVPKANLVKSRARQKLQTEIKIHRTMKHANICEYKHFFEDKVNCYILLELCHNQSMNEMIKRRKTLTEEETRLLMLQIVDAITFMHDSNVIHRDLKLGNLFLSKNMNIKVGDFGLACRVDSSDEKRRTICGTPNYIAPEVIEGNKEKRGHSFEVDIWSLGVICFTMLVGKPPYESTDVKSTYRRILANEYSFPIGKVSDDARRLIASMLQTNPKMRPSLDEVRRHPFFTMHQIPSSIPPSCTVSAPIWFADEFGELIAIKPTSALDVPSSKTFTNTTTNNLHAGKPSKYSGTGGIQKSDTMNAHKHIGTSAAVGAFNIYDDVNDEVDVKVNVEAVECKLETQGSAPVLIASLHAETPVNMLTEKMAFCGFDDEARELPPGVFSSTPSSFAESKPPPVAPSAAEYSEPKHLISPSEACTKRQPSSHPSPTNSDDLQELITMHSRLEECLANYERIQNGGPKVECPLKGGEVWGAKKWVTRYVDYTSKYGLGFLLNDGSSGVYFNDSTKAVHSAEGVEFVYVERRKAGSRGGSEMEPVFMYTMSNFPEDSLKKKVTLLQHFRSYLLDQQKRAEDAGEAEPLASNFEERQDTTDGATDSIPMVFIKKWIKTKHAMLFRLSNGTIQVLFYDMTEVLISSEGKLVTFVDKDKNRFVLSIAEIVNKQHGDVSRRLKYAKEILSQLISASQR